MALKARDQVKTVFGATALTLLADTGESFLVKDIRIYSAAGTYLTIKTEKTTVGYFRIDATYGNHLSFSQTKDTTVVIAQQYLKNLLSYLFGLGIFKGYPIAEGERMIISGAEGAADVKSVIYDIYEAADQKNDAPNGSKSLEYMLINYGDTGAVIDTPGDQRYDNPLNPVEFPAFPYFGDVPSKYQISIHGILGSEQGVRNATPATAIYTRYLKMVKDREVLFDEDRNGIPFDFSAITGAAGTKVAGGYSFIGNYNHVDPRPPLLFSEPIVFEGGDELNIYSTTVEPIDASSIAALFQVIGLIETIRRITGT